MRRGVRLHVAEDVCVCDPMPLNFWRSPDGEWTAHELGDPARDAILYERSGAVAWVIACPECGSVYAGGTTL